MCLQIPHKKALRYYDTYPVTTTELILDMLRILSDKIELSGIERRDFNEIKQFIENREG